MANWKTVQERWLPIVEKMEEHSMDDYAIPEIYRAAEKEIDELVLTCECVTRSIKRGWMFGIDHALGDIGTERSMIVALLDEAVNKHKGD